MGGGKGGGGCQLVGYGYSLTMMYAFCEKADKVSGWKVNDKVWWIDNDILADGTQYNTYQKSLYTGKKGEVYHSDGSDHTNITFYLSDYAPISYPQNKVGYDIKLNNIAFASLPNAFVGDNTTAVPKYNARLSRFSINGQDHKVGVGSINPIAVIKEIMQKFLKISVLDSDSFDTAYNICSQEGLGIAFIMTTEKKVKRWLQEILRVIDGVMWFDTIVGKWKIKLFRPDYDINNVFEISEDNAAKIEITSGSWDNLINEFTFKYTNMVTGKTDSFTLENSALFNIMGYKMGKTYTYQIIGEYEIMAKVANRVIKKNSKPLSSLKARISILDLPYIELGGVIKVVSTKLDIDDKYFRITKIGGDKEDDVYIDIEGTEEVWEVNYTGSIISNPVTSSGASETYDISQIEPYIVKVMELPNYFVDNLKSINQPIGSIVTYPQNYENQYEITGTNNKYGSNSKAITKTKTQIYYFGKLGNSFQQNNDYISESQSISIKPYSSSSYCDLPTISQTDTEWQQNKWLLLIGDEFFSIKNITTINQQDHTYQISGIIRLSDKSSWNDYAGSTPVYLININSVSDIIDFYLDTYNDSVQLSSQFYNYTTKSTYKNDTKSISGVARKLLSPTYNYVYEDGGNLYLVFSKMARGVNTGATFDNIENITAGEKEGAGEETHIVVKYDGSSTKEISLDASNVISDTKGIVTINLTQISSDITYSNIEQIKTKCIQTTYTLQSNFIDVNKV